MLAGGTSLVLILVALTSVTYLASTLFPALAALDLDLELIARPSGLPSSRLARNLGVSVTAMALLAAAFGLRVGAPGHGGELLPSVALAVAASAALGAGAALGALGAGKAARALAAARRARAMGMDAAAQQRSLDRVMERIAFSLGNDLIEQREDAEEALSRLAAALHALEATGAEVEARLAALDEAARAGDLGQALSRTRDEVEARIALGRRMHAAATAAAFRFACNVPVRMLLRQRPKAPGPGLAHAVDEEAAEALAFAFTEIETFMSSVRRARAELEQVALRRPPIEMEGDDPYVQAVRDVDAIEAAYQAIANRIGVASLRLSARAGMRALTSAAGDVSEKARAGSIPSADLAGLFHEVARADAAVRVATPPELDGRALSEAMAQGAEALGEGGDGAKLDELLRALREAG